MGIRNQLNKDLWLINEGINPSKLRKGKHWSRQLPTGINSIVEQQSNKDS